MSSRGICCPSGVGRRPKVQPRPMLAGGFTSEEEQPSLGGQTFRLMNRSCNFPPLQKLIQWSVAMERRKKDRNGRNNNAARAAECARRAADKSLHADVRESWKVMARSYAALA